LLPTTSVVPAMAGEERTMSPVAQVRRRVPSGFTA
jgi:hypothetical protein